MVFNSHLFLCEQDWEMQEKLFQIYLVIYTLGDNLHRAGMRRGKMKACCQGELYLMEQKQGNTEGECFHMFVEIEMVTAIWACTSITDATLSSAAEA